MTENDKTKKYDAVTEKYDAAWEKYNRSVICDKCGGHMNLHTTTPPPYWADDQERVAYECAVANSPKTSLRRLSKLEQAVADAQGKGQPFGTTQHVQLPVPVAASSVLDIPLKQERIFMTRQEFDDILKWQAEPIHVHCACCQVLFPLAPAQQAAYMVPPPGGELCPKCENAQHSTVMAYRTLLDRLRSSARAWRFWVKALLSKEEDE